MIDKLIGFLCRHCKHMSVYTFYDACNAYARKDYLIMPTAIDFWMMCKKTEADMKPHVNA